MSAPLVNPARHAPGQPIRLNIGCGAYPLRGYTNIDNSAESAADVFATVPPIPYEDETVTEVWACHFLEHLDQDDGNDFLSACYRVLEPGGQLGLVVPDTREIMRRWLAGEHGVVEYPAGRFWDTRDLDDVCAMFLYSTVQESHHRWSYDLGTLTRAVERAGFRVLREIDRHYDPRLGSGAWYQCGVQAVKGD